MGSWKGSVQQTKKTAGQAILFCASIFHLTFSVIIQERANSYNLANLCNSAWFAL